MMRLPPKIKANNFKNTIKRIYDSINKDIRAMYKRSPKKNMPQSPHEIRVNGGLLRQAFQQVSSGGTNEVTFEYMTVAQNSKNTIRESFTYINRYDYWILKTNA